MALTLRLLLADEFKMSSNKSKMVPHEIWRFSWIFMLETFKNKFKTRTEALITYK